MQSVSGDKINSVLFLFIKISSISFQFTGPKSAIFDLNSLSACPVEITDYSSANSLPKLIIF